MIKEWLQEYQSKNIEETGLGLREIMQEVAQEICSRKTSSKISSQKKSETFQWK
jgi:hypothetical protein